MTTVLHGEHRRRGPASLTHAPFRRLTIAWVFTNLADSALYLMLAVWMKELTGSDGAAALVFAMLGIPALAAPFMGQIADRLSRKKLLVWANLAVALAVCTLFAVNSAAGVGWIYGVILIYGAVAYLTGAAQGGLVRDMLPDEHLASGNALLSTIDQSLRLISPLLGTALYALWGPHAVVALTALAFLVAATILTTLRVQESPPLSAAERGRYWQELTAGFRHLLAHSVLGRLTVVIGIAFGATGLMNVAAFPIIEHGLGLPAAALGPIVSIQGVGAVLAGLTAASAIRRFGEVRIFAAGVLTLGVGMTPGLAPHLLTIGPGLAAIGFGVTWSVVAFITLRQRLTPARLQGRVGSATAISINLPQTIVTFIGAAVVGIVDYRILILITIIVVLGSVTLMPRGQR